MNPPYYVKLVELVPHPETTAAVMDAAHALMTQVNISDYYAISGVTRRKDANISMSESRYTRMRVLQDVHLYVFKRSQTTLLNHYIESV